MNIVLGIIGAYVWVAWLFFGVALVVSPLAIWHHVAKLREEHRREMECVLRGLQYICDRLCEDQSN